MMNPYDYIKLSPDQRRELLKSQGLSDEEINKQTELLELLKTKPAISDLNT